MNRTVKHYFPIFVLPTLIAFIIAFAVPFVMGLVLSMSGITIALFLVTKQTAVLLTGGALLLCALVGIFVLTQAFGKRLSQFTADLCQTLDHMIAGNEAPQRPEDSETLRFRYEKRTVPPWET